MIESVFGFIGRHPGIILVLIGVVGEVIFDWGEMKGKHSWAKKLSAFILIAGLSIEFFEAAKSDREVVAANERIKYLESTNLTLVEKVEKLRAENNALEAQIQPRRITEEQKAKVIKILGTDHKPGPIVFRFFANDPEAQVFTSQIWSILTVCGFEIDNRWSASLSLPSAQDRPTFGLIMTVSPHAFPTPQRAKSIFKAFNEVGIKMDQDRDWDLPTNAVLIVVGAKPLYDANHK